MKGTQLPLHPPALSLRRRLPSSRAGKRASSSGGGAPPGPRALTRSRPAWATGLGGAACARLLGRPSPLKVALSAAAPVRLSALRWSCGVPSNRLEAAALSAPVPPAPPARSRSVPEPRLWFSAGQASDAGALLGTRRAAVACNPRTSPEATRPLCSSPSRHLRAPGQAKPKSPPPAPNFPPERGSCVCPTPRLGALSAEAAFLLRRLPQIPPRPLSARWLQGGRPAQL